VDVLSQVGYSRAEIDRLMADGAAIQG
jgi:predicted DNA-binding transcriptional regulator AlpA